MNDVILGEKPVERGTGAAVVECGQQLKVWAAHINFPCGHRRGLRFPVLAGCRKGCELILKNVCHGFQYRLQVKDFMFC